MNYYRKGCQLVRIGQVDWQKIKTNLLSLVWLYCRKLIRVFLFGSFVCLSACASIEPASEAGIPLTNSYTQPEQSGLRSYKAYPGSDDVCVSLRSNRLIAPFELDGHIIIACPKHEVGAIADRKLQQQAKIVGNAKHWVVLRVPLKPELSS